MTETFGNSPLKSQKKCSYWFFQDSDNFIVNETPDSTDGHKWT